MEEHHKAGPSEVEMQPQKTDTSQEFTEDATKESDTIDIDTKLQASLAGDEPKAPPMSPSKAPPLPSAADDPERTPVLEETGPKDQPEKKSKEPVGQECNSLIDSNAIIGWGLVFALLMCFALILAAILHGWSQESICAFIQSADQEPQDYPQPRCFNTSRFRNKTVIDNSGGFFYYYWRLPKMTWEGQFFAWLGYSLHQWSIWILLYLAQKKYSSDIKTNASNDSKPDCETKTETGKKNRPKKYSVKMRTLNWISLGVNVFFHFAHLLQTHVFYDALAPTVYEGASQGSVIFMLLFIMMMETERRGIFFGYGIATALDVSDIVKRYHGYIFSWAVIFTFWYHPMEPSMGHLFGFMHTWMVMLQGSLMFTTAHLNYYWRLVCESWVFVHATVIAMQTLPGWPSFTFGFGAIFVVTQLPGLPCMLKLHPVIRLIPVFIFIIIWVMLGFMSATVASTNPGRLLGIPVIMWLCPSALNLFMLGVLRVGERFCWSHRKGTSEPPAETNSCKVAAWTFLAGLVMAVIVFFTVMSEHLTVFLPSKTVANCDANVRGISATEAELCATYNNGTEAFGSTYIHDPNITAWANLRNLCTTPDSSCASHEITMQTMDAKIECCAYYPKGLIATLLTYLPMAVGTSLLPLILMEALPAHLLTHNKVRKRRGTWSKCLCWQCCCCKADKN